MSFANKTDRPLSMEEIEALSIRASDLKPISPNDIIRALDTARLANKIREAIGDAPGITMNGAAYIKWTPKIREALALWKERE